MQIINYLAINDKTRWFWRCHSRNSTFDINLRRWVLYTLLLFGLSLSGFFRKQSIRSLWETKTLLSYLNLKVGRYSFKISYFIFSNLSKYKDSGGIQIYVVYCLKKCTSLQCQIRQKNCTYSRYESNHAFIF